ncbi:MAG: Crp/Fnr family transcriptional regulator [Proteobacteria bacterium]|nr:Crp/Fnr family transcriptional regulator [Pseudomonadota bacterium]
MKNLDESLLADIPPFRKLQNAQIREILDSAIPKRFDAGVSVFEEGMDADRFYLLLDGHIRVIRTTPEGEQVIALYIASGQLFGLAPALGRKQYPATAMTADECLTLSWPTRIWPEFVAKYDGFATETYKIVGSRVDEMHSRIVEMATQHVEQRVACSLLRLINQTGKKVAKGVEIEFPITRQNISEMTGTTLHTVSRLLSAWQKAGIIVSGRRKITVIKPDELVLLTGAKA